MACVVKVVSTHSRPKAAGSHLPFEIFFKTKSFNTQPPEGGWYRPLWQTGSQIGFNTQPPEGGWDNARPRTEKPLLFQHTAARRRLGPRT